MKVFKYTLAKGANTIHMPQGATILDMQEQRGEVAMWALTDETAPLEERHFSAYYTGALLPDNPATYVATAQFHGGDTVLHVFEDH